MRQHKVIRTLTAPNAARVSAEEKNDRFPSGRIYRAILKFSVTDTTSGGASDGTSVQDTPFTYLNRIKILMGGREIVNITGLDAFLLASVLDGVAPPSSVPAISGNAAYTYTGELPIYFAPPESLVPEAALLMSHGQLDPQIFVTYGLRTDLQSGGDRTHTLSAETVTLSCDFETSEIRAALYHFLNGTTANIAAAQTDFPIELMFGRGLRYRFIYLRAFRAGVRSDAQVNRVRLKAGQDVIIYDSNWSTIQAENRRWFGIAPPVGVAIVFFDTTMRYQRLLDTSELGELRLELDVAAPSGTTNVTVVNGQVKDIPKS